MKKLLLILTVLLFVSCKKDAISSTTEGKGFEVELLFQKDNVKVYRFSDGGRYHYFTTLGETMTSHFEVETSYHENIK